MIQKINTYDYSHGRFKGKHYVEISYETWTTFNLGKPRTTISCEVNSLLKNKKESVFAGSEQGYCKPRYWVDSKENAHHDLIFSSHLVRSIGIREGLYVDMLLTQVNYWGGDFAKIFPKRLVYGVIEINPNNLNEHQINGSNNLIDHNFTDSFFANLAIEINRAYGFRLYNSTLILSRKLIENILIDLLRTKFGMQKVDMFYNADKGKFHDFFTLLDNLEQNLSEFRPYSTAFEKSLIQFLNKFREKSNSVAHSIETQPDWDYVESLKKDLNYYCQVFDSTIEKI